VTRRRRLPRDQRRQTLLNAARDVLMARGYGELTMARVAQQAGVSKTLVYDHFAHRRELYLAVLAEEQVRLVHRLAPALAYGDRATRVRSGVEAFLALVDEYGDGYPRLFRNPIAHDPELAAELRHMRDGVAELVAGIIAGDAGVPIETVLLPAHGIVGPMEAAADWLTRTPPGERPATPQAAELLSRLIWQGLEGVGELGSSRAASEPVQPVPLRPRRAR
jgi:AcrR family transcriptional regulator